MTRNVLSLEEAKRKFKDALASRFESKRTTAVAVVTSIERDAKSLHTTGKVRATIDGVADQSVFIGAGTGVSVGQSLRVENRAGGIGPEWVSLGKTGSVAGVEGTVDTGRPLTTPTGFSWTSSVYMAGTSAAARIIVTWTQNADWESVAYYEIAYYVAGDAANQHVSNAPHVNEQVAASQYAILALRPGTSYSVKMRAIGYGGAYSSWTSLITATTATDATVPGVPTGFGAIQISDTALRFYWAQNAESDFSYYEIGVFSGTDVVDDLLSGYPLSTGDTPEHIHNVTPATNRYFRVRSVDTSGNASAWSTPLSGPHATVETITGSIILSDIINQSYGLGLLGDPSKIIIDLATASGLAFEGGTGNLMLDDSVAGAGLGITDKVLAVSADRLLSVASDAVGITAGATYQFIGTGSGTAAGWRDVSELAGSGLTHTAGVLAVGVKEGVEIDADALRVNKSYDYTWTGIHTFQTNDVQMGVNLDFVGPQSITTSSGALSISPNGGSLLLDANLDFVGPQSITSSSGDLTLSPYTAVLIPGAKILGSSSFDSSFPITGWRINETNTTHTRTTAAGDTRTTAAGDVRTVAFLSGQSALTIGVISADELSVKVFVADETRVDRGDEYWTKSYGILTEPFFTPVIAGTVTITFEDSPAIVGAIFEEDDWLLFRKIDITTGLTVASLWGQVNAPPSGSDNGDDTQSWVYTHRSGAAGVAIKKGDIGIDFGASGAALIHLSVIDPAGAPYIKMRRWAGADPFTPANYTTYVQLGNLGSIGNPNYTPTGDGLWVRSTASDGQFIVADNVGLQIRGADFYVYDGASPVFKIDHSAPSLALGTTLPTEFGDSGIWMGKHSDGTYRMSIEESGGNQYLRWTHDGSRYYLDIAGNLYLHDSPGAGGDDLGATLTIDSHGQIVMGSNGSIAMGASSTFTADANSTLSIGDSGTGDYLNFSDGVLTIKGKIIVTDGEDFLPEQYQPAAISAAFAIDVQPESTYLVAGPPYGVSVNIAGTMEMADGSRYWLYSGSMGILTSASRYFKLTVRKTSVAPFYGSVDLPTTEDGYSNVVTIAVYEVAEWEALSEATRDARIIIADMYLTADFTEIVTLSFRAASSITIITPDFIRTPNLRALSADLGAITAGTITIENGTNTVWLNNGTSDIVLAAGDTSDGIAAATFKVWENGSVNLGSATLGKYVNWNTSTGALIVKGDIRADAGYLGSLNVDGNLTMNDGKIQWNSNNSYIDDNKIVVEDVSGYSTLLIGDRSQTYYGVLDITLDAGGDGGWQYGIRLVDGGNTIANATALYRGVSGISGATAVDRIFSAASANASYSDGFYAEMASFGGWDNFDTAGVPFKGIHNAGGPVALFNQQGGGADAPVVWMTSQNTNRSIAISEMGANGQIAFRVIDNGYSGYALWTDGQKIDMGDARIENMNIINFTTSVSGTPPWTPVVNFGGASNRTVVKWLRLEAAGTTYQIPLFANGSFN